MKKEKLTLRQKKIIEILIYEENNMPLTISHVSDKLKVSRRTILREMPYVEKWLKDNNFKFIKKPGILKRYFPKMKEEK